MMIALTLVYSHLHDRAMDSCPKKLSQQPRYIETCLDQTNVEANVLYNIVVLTFVVTLLVRALIDFLKSPSKFRFVRQNGASIRGLTSDVTTIFTTTML